MAAQGRRDRKREVRRTFKRRDKKARRRRIKKSVQIGGKEKERGGRRMTKRED